MSTPEVVKVKALRPWDVCLDGKTNETLEKGKTYSLPATLAADGIALKKVAKVGNRAKTTK